MSNTITKSQKTDRYTADFCFTAEVLGQVDAVDICEAFGLLPVVDAATEKTAIGRKPRAVVAVVLDDGGDVFAPMA